ncbi:MAG: M1 family metallopeptidase [Blastocatellia bacterium]|nr:M1 family metallopeptidase [Blastocatellia bacterium]
MRIFASFGVLLLIACSAVAQRELGVRPTETGGPLRFEQAVYDVQSYDVGLTVTPATRSIAGVTTMTALTVIPTNVIILDLDTPYRVDSITDGNLDLRFDRRGDEIWIWFPMTKQVGDEIKTVVSYAGSPRLAPRAPWIGGFMWQKTPSGADWVSVALQNDGADLMFPCKDHPSDKASQVTMNISVPDPLIAVGPGKLVATKKPNPEYTTYTWRMTNPIPNYSIVFDAAPYKLIRTPHRTAISGPLTIDFYVLPENADKAPSLIAEQKKYIAFMEKYLGPVPFRSQKVGIVETPHLGMEHSTHIAYGNKFKYNEDGTDWLLLHEYGHEYWANLVTASDWRDFWIHEGFQTYMDALYVEHLNGKPKYLKTMAAKGKTFRNKQPVAPRESKIAYQVYMVEPDYLRSDGDIYGKGAYILHTLRYLIGDAAFFRALRRMAYPTKAHERATDGSQTRLVNTDDFLAIAEAESGRDLDWFFELYLRQPRLPKLVNRISGGTLNLRWETPNEMTFSMPIEVVVNGRPTRVEMRDGKASVSFTGAVPVIDPDGWVLREQ